MFGRGVVCLSARGASRISSASNSANSRGESDAGSSASPPATNSSAVTSAVSCQVNGVPPWGSSSSAAGVPSRGWGSVSGHGQGNPLAASAACTEMQPYTRGDAGRTLRTTFRPSSRRSPNTRERFPVSSSTAAGSAPSHRTHHATRTPGIAGAGCASPALCGTAPSEHLHPGGTAAGLGRSRWSYGLAGARAPGLVLGTVASVRVTPCGGRAGSLPVT